MTEPSVQLQDIVKRHGQTVAVDHLSLSIGQQEFFSILGPSGSGKTTILRLVAGLDRPDHGEIVILGRSMTDRPPNQRPVNMVFQHYALFPHMTVAQNVAFGLLMRGEPRRVIDRQVASILDLVRLTGKEDRYPSQLSGGEQQRVALARALVNRPAVLLLDEPLGALDQQLRHVMQAELQQIQRQVRCSFILVTHHQEEALMLSDRVAVLHRGQLQQLGTPEELYESPKSLFVAQFIGLSNTLSGRIAIMDDSTCTIENGHRPPIRAPRPAALSFHAPVTFVVRPERLRLLPYSTDASHNGAINRVIGTIAKAIYNGNEMLYHVEWGEGMTWIVRTPLLERSPRFTVGDHVLIHWHWEEGLVFPS
ncbi:MAG: ABC transporter ATP-binding protein [Nitrospirae bacterium]|nr:MAG: ABC transporter ATP-binding protein [Nitrospirota bacterium]